MAGRTHTRLTSASTTIIKNDTEERSTWSQGVKQQLAYFL
jgi:hypothetical protein